MNYDPVRRRRRRIRIAGYDYSQPGMYFVTICAKDGACLFGEIVGDQMRLNALGRVVEKCWREIPAHFPHAVLDGFAIMPNHVHGIVVMVGATDASPVRAGPRAGSVGAIVGSFKAATTRGIHGRRGTPGAAVWQRGYYEHVIRNGESLDRIRRYIAGNPARWAFDRENPQAVDPEPADAWALP